MAGNYFTDYNSNTKTMALLFVGIFGAIVIDTAAVLLAEIFNMGSVLSGYQSLGRYMIAFAHGEASFPDSNFLNLPKLQGETVVGLSAHFLVCLLDTYLYFLLTFKILASRPKLILALLLMWLLMSMPLYLEMPALGMGWAGANSAVQEILLFRTFVCHTAYGVALYAGTILFDKLVKLTNT